MSKADPPTLLTGLLSQEEGGKGAGEGHVYFLTPQAAVMTIKEYVGKEVRGPSKKGDFPLYQDQVRKESPGPTMQYYHCI